ncbi:DUF6958 family protein [Brevirhabdus sp.]|uniref:DUF6958 family protein n=1 Tax=Brevirhabdus sp. TaxID=2004514 RepID=UPI004059F255
MIEIRVDTGRAVPVLRPRDWKFALVRAAILEAVEHLGAPEFPCRELPAAVAARLTARQRAALGSIGWITKMVMCEMQLAGELRLSSTGGAGRMARTVP